MSTRQVNKPVNVALLGAGAYGSIYVAAILASAESSGVRLVAVADPFVEASRVYGVLKARGVQTFHAGDRMLAACKPDLTVVCTPIQDHCENVLAALAVGSHVLCEKPLCASLGEARKLLDASHRFGRHVAVGFQWSFGKAVQDLKRDVVSGVLGRPKRMRTLVLWPRNETYYSRNGWAGRSTDERGRFVYDSPVNNACAHFLHNMLYVLGHSADRSAMPVTLRAELYRAKKIENFDTAAMCATMRDGTELLFITSHASRGLAGPVFEYEFENATVTYDEMGCGEFVATFKDGTVKRYGKPPGADEPGKLFDTIRAIHAGEPSLCPVEAAIPQLAVTVAAQEGCEISNVPDHLICTDGDPGSRAVWVRGIDSALMRCYREFKLPGDIGFDWAVPSEEIVMEPEPVFSLKGGAMAATGN
jgi:predicted dehydrogenase